ncbi:MAG: hypothetical protein ACI4LA_08135 [Emergencia sp.]
MKKSIEMILIEAGFINIEKYVDERIVNGSSWQERIRALRQYQAASEKFHCPGGDGYNCVLNCLQKYLDYKFIRTNNEFRFGEHLFDCDGAGADICVSTLGENPAEYTYIANSRTKPIDRRPMAGTRADIYYLLHEAEQIDIASRRCIEYVSSNRLHLSAVLTQLIERIVETLESDGQARRRQFGQLIRTAYMDPDFADSDMTAIYNHLGVSKKQYYRIRNQAIELISETLFGILSGEQGLTELYIRDDTIVIPVMRAKEAKRHLTEND